MIIFDQIIDATQVIDEIPYRNHKICFSSENWSIEPLKSMRLIMSTLYVLMAFLWLKIIKIYVKDLISLLAQKEKDNTLPS